MRTLRNVIPTPEQATVIDNANPGYWLIRGAAGCGKTTTALLRLKFLVRYWQEQKLELGVPGPVRVLVLTFNRTLRGYIDELARRQIHSGPEVSLQVTTFGAWAQHLLGRSILDREPAEARIRQLAGSDFPWHPRFLTDEVDYVLGRFLPGSRELYLTTERTGRGSSPQVGRKLRRRLLSQVVEPYQAWKAERGVVDWSDLAVELALQKAPIPMYEVVVVDEAQDFSANQVRAVANHVADDFVCTFIRDTVQRIYPNYFSWRDVGIDMSADRSKRLRENYRNTKQVAAFARPLVDGLDPVEGDGSVPDFTCCEREGIPPIVVRGKYSKQAEWALTYLDNRVADDETVAFLHPLGGGWFRELRSQLRGSDISWVSLSREAEWPEGDERVALCTMHSAKGLEFDHVILLGYDAETVEVGEEDERVMLEQQRRLLAMAVGRARKGVVVGYRVEAESAVARFLDPATFDTVDL